MGMKTNVSTLLREFPKIRQTVMAGEEVIIVTREGNLRLTAEPKDGASVLGALKNQVKNAADDLDQPTTQVSDWEASLS